MPRLSLLSLLALAACGGDDPILERAEALSAAAPPGANSPGPAAQPAPGTPSQPPPAAAAPPGAGTPPSPTPGTPQEPPPGGGPGGPTQGPSVTLSGVIQLAQPTAGAVRIDVFDGDQRDLSGPRPQVVGMGKIAAAGPFSVAVPQSAAKVWIGAFVDVDGDGRPGPAEPSGWYARNPVSTASGDVNNINLSLAVEGRPPAGKGELQ